MSLYSSLFLLVGALLALFLVYLQYKDLFFQQRSKSIILASLRWISYFIVLLLLVNIQLESTTTEKQNQQLILLSDASTSMLNFTNENEVREVINQIQTNDKLRQKFDISTYSFGEGISVFQKTENFQINESQTNISKALSELHDIYRNQEYSLVLISDGNQNLGEDYTQVARRLNQKIFPLVVGDTTKIEDLKIDRINNNNYVFLDNKFLVEVFISYEGNKAINSTTRLMQAGNEVAKKEINFSPSRRTQRLTFEVLATKKGIQTYEIVVDPFENETFTENNSATISIEVIDDFSSILILSNQIHPDIGMLKRSLGKSKRSKIETSLVTEFDGDLGNYNLLILYQPNRTFNSVINQAQLIGLNALIFTGTKTDYAFVQEKFPYFSRETSRSTEDYYPLYNPKFNLFQQEDIGFANFPPLQDLFGEIRPRGNTSSLLFQQIQGFATENPLLFFTEVEGKRYGFFIGENSWRWRSQYFVDNKNVEGFDDFMGKITQYLTSSTTKKRLIVEAENLYTTKLGTEVKATFFDANYQLDSRAQVSIQLTNTHSSETNDFPMPWRGNYFGFPLKNLADGEYEFEVSVNDKEFTYNGKFTLEEADQEQKFIRPDLASMQSVGFEQNYFLLSDLDELMSYLAEKDSLKPSLKSVKKNQSLIDWQYLLLFLIVSLSTEWFIRKYNGLT